MNTPAQNFERQLRQHPLPVGAVYKQASGIFGIVVYRSPGSNKTEVISRVIDTDSVYEACEILSREFAGEFKPADIDQTQWGQIVAESQGSCRVLL